jgi:hypothetical protein
MENKKNIKNEIIVNVICIILILVVFISFSFGMFVDTDTGSSNIITFGDINMIFCEGSNINCTSGKTSLDKTVGVDETSVPVVMNPTDSSTALASDPYTFTIQNTGDLDLTITIFIESETISNYSNEAEENIYIAFQEVGVSTPTISLLSELNAGSLGKILGSTNLNVNSAKTFYVWTWVKEDAPNGVQDTYFAAKVIVQGEYIPYSSMEEDTSYESNTCETAVAFSTDSWETIACNVKNGNTSAYNVGDTKEVTLDGYGTHTLRIANTSSPDECNTEGFSQSACGFVLEFADIIAKYNMNDTKTNIGGWPASAMYKLVNGTDDTTYSVYETDDETFTVKSIYMSLPEDLRNVIIDTTTISGHGSTTGETNFTSTDKLYLLSTAEIWAQGTTNTIDYDTARDVTRQLDYYSNQAVTTSSYSAAIKQYNGSDYLWWLRSAYSSNDTNVYSVDSTGYWNDYSAYVTIIGVSPAFRIG